MCEFEGLAEVGQGVLAGRVAEPSAGEGGSGHGQEANCLNCAAVLVGSHCHVCGQAAHVHRTLGAFFHDLLHGVFHFEGKIWRTLPLLVVHPGRVTREYIDGRRASYVSPIALFLFGVFLMFAVFHATVKHHPVAQESLPGQDKVAVSELRKSIAQLEKQKAQTAARGDPTFGIDQAIRAQKLSIDAMDTSEGGAIVSGDSGSDIRALDRAIRTFRANPELASYKIQTYAYKYSWLLIPISVPFVWLLFPFSRRFHLYDHTVFVTYSLCFATGLAIVAMLLDAMGVESVASLLVLLPPIHMYRQLRGTYALGRVGAAWRTVLLMAFAGAALLIFFVAIMTQISD